MIYRPLPTEALMDEALIRIRGELMAVGLRVEVRRSEEHPTSPPHVFSTGDYGALFLVQRRKLIEIRAYAPELEGPVFQAADTEHPEIDAEVVAIRAVEALRAAMVQYARQRRREQALPDAVSGFTKLTKDAAAPRKPPAAAEVSLSDRPGRVKLNAFVGPSLVLDLSSSLNAWGAQGAFVLGSAWYRVGVIADRTLTAFSVEQIEGTAQLFRTSGSVRLGAHVEVASPLVGFVGIAGGLAHYAIDAEAAPRFSAQASRHVTALFGMDAGAGYFFSEHVGAYFGLRMDFAANAPELLFDSRPIAVFGRPTGSVSIGLMLGQ